MADLPAFFAVPEGLPPAPSIGTLFPCHKVGPAASPLVTGLRIGGVTIPNNLILAPMAGVTDGPFRIICSTLGAGLTVSELVSAKALCMGSSQSLDMIRIPGHPRPYSVQIFGSEPDSMARAAAIVESLGICDMIDINMGCPVAKVIKTGAGVALMRNPQLAEKILRSVVSAVSVPVTVKTRLGWSPRTITVRDFVKRMVDGGAAAVTVHARTKEDGYGGSARWEHMTGLSEVTGPVPLIANGDIHCIGDLSRLAEVSGCRGFMIGRGAVGKPWIFQELLGNPLPIEPASRFAIFRRHLLEMLMEHGAKGTPLFRVHLFNYLRNHPFASQMRGRLCNEYDPRVVLGVGREFFLGGTDSPGVPSPFRSE